MFLQWLLKSALGQAPEVQTPQQLLVSRAVASETMKAAKDVLQDVKLLLETHSAPGDDELNMLVQLCEFEVAITFAAQHEIGAVMCKTHRYWS